MPGPHQWSSAGTTPCFGHPRHPQHTGFTAGPGLHCPRGRESPQRGQENQNLEFRFGLRFGPRVAWDEPQSPPPPSKLQCPRLSFVQHVFVDRLSCAWYRTRRRDYKQQKRQDSCPPGPESLEEGDSQPVNA